MSETLYRKYRPNQFSLVSGQEHIKTTIQNQLISNKVAQAYLFTGPRGVGKTTLARLLAKAVNCNVRTTQGEPCETCSSCQEISTGSALDIVELDAASHTDVDTIREHVIRQAQFAPSSLKRKVFIIDEVHMLSASSFNALLKTLEEPPAHAMFILATTEMHKVPDTIVSRCQRFDFHRLSAKALRDRLETIVELEKRSIDASIISEIIRRADGCARDAESLLDQILAIAGDHVSEEDARLILPHSTGNWLADTIESMVKKDVNTCLGLIEDAMVNGTDMGQLSDDLVVLLRDLLMIRLGGPIPDTWGEDWCDRLQKLAGSLSPTWLIGAIEKFVEARRHVRSEQLPQLGLELACVHICLDGEEVPFFQSSRSEPIKSTPEPVVTVTPTILKTVTPEKPEVTPIEQKIKEPASLVVETVFSAPPLGLVTTIQEQEISETEQINKSVLEIDISEDVVTTTVSDAQKTSLNIEIIKGRWDKVIEEVKSRNASLPLVFQNGTVSKVEDGWVEVSFEFSFHAEMLNQEKNSSLVDKILTEVFGQPLKVKGVSVIVAIDDTVSQLLSEFGGTVS